MENDSDSIYNSGILNTFILLLKHKYPKANIHKILKSSKITMSEIEDPDKWFTQKEISDFHTEVQKETNEVDIAYKAGIFAAKPQAMNILKDILQLQDPINVYKKINKFAEQLSKSAIYKTEILSNNSVKITVTYEKEEELFQCKNRRGYLEAIPKIFGYKANVEHDKNNCCHLSDNKKCVYSISLKKLKTEIAEDYRELVKTIDYKNRSISIIQEISKKLGECKFHNDIIEQSLDYLKKEQKDFKRYIIWAADDEKKQLIYQDSRGCSDDEIKILKETPFNIKKIDEVGPLIKCFQNKKPELVNDIEYISDTMTPKTKGFVEKMKVKSFICCPIYFGEDKYGVLEADNKADDAITLTQEDVDLLMNVAYQIGSALYYRTVANNNLNKNREKHSAHTFNKCYNTPIKNICHRLRQILYLENPFAKFLTISIEDFIDLWANEHSALTNVPTKFNQQYNNKKWIDGFSWNGFKDDLENFMYHIFYLCINDLYDHVNEEEIPQRLRPMSKIWEPLNAGWDQAISWKNFINFEFSISHSDSDYLLGIRPLFRVILINMLQNAIEAIDFYSVAQQYKIQSDTVVLPKIKFSIDQNEDETVITVLSEGFVMHETLVKKYQNDFKEIYNNPKNYYHDSNYDEIIEKKEYTSKSGTGSGIALIEAALYFAKIIHIKDGKINRGQMTVKTEINEKLSSEYDKKMSGNTTFSITLPYGKKMTKAFDESPLTFQDAEERIAYQWSLLFDDNNINQDGEKNNSTTNSKLSNDENKGTYKSELSKYNENIPLEKIDVLIIEDSRPDRYRFRDILTERGLTFAFTWDARYKQMLDIESIMNIINTCNPSRIILDLAWTIDDERILEKLRFMSCKELHDNEKRIKQLNAFQFLDTITEKYKDSGTKFVNPQIIIVTQYIFTVTYGISEYITKHYIQEANLRITIINKWRQEIDLKKLIK